MPDDDPEFAEYLRLKKKFNKQKGYRGQSRCRFDFAYFGFVRDWWTDYCLDWWSFDSGWFGTKLGTNQW